MSRKNLGRERQRAALDRVKAAKSGGVSRLEEHEFEQEGDVYDLVDEEEYAAIVETR